MGNYKMSSNKTRLVMHILCTAAMASTLKEHLEKNVVNHCCLSVLKNRPNYAQIVLQAANAEAFAKYIFHDDLMPLLDRKIVKINQATLVARFRPPY